MKESMRAVVAGAVGAVVATTVLTAQPVLADQVERAARKVTSAQIKDGTVKRKDLSAEVTGSLAKADSALQGIPDGSVTTGKIANGAVTGPKLAGGSVTSGTIQNGAVGTSDIAEDSVNHNHVQDGGLNGSDIADGTIAGADVSDGSVGLNDIGPNSVGSAAVVDDALRLYDVAKASGSEIIDFPGLSAGQCAQSSPIGTGGEDLDDAIVLVENPATVAGAMQIQARQTQPGFTSFVVIACALAGFDAPSADYTWAVLR